MWLKASGFDLSAHAIRIASVQILILASVLIGLRWILRRMEGKERRLFLWVGLIVALFVFAFGFPPPIAVNFLGVVFSPREILSVIAFPPSMAVLVGGAALAAWWFFLRSQLRSQPTIALILTFSSLLSIRSLMQTESVGLPIYYNGPELLCILIIASLLVTPLTSSRRLRLSGTVLICVASVTSVVINSNISLPYFKSFTPLITDRGTILLPPPTAENYKAAIAFMKQQSTLGNAVMSIPEDTSLYFFSDTQCPTRVPGFVPGVVAPGEMTDEILAQLKKQPPRFLIWSNREYPEYGARVFGTDFDRPIGDYLRSHYRPIGSLVPFDPTHWSAIIWERTSSSVSN